MNTRKLHWAALEEGERMGGGDSKGKDVGKMHHKEWEEEPCLLTP